MKLLAKFNIILLVIFGAGGLLIAHFAYNFLVGNARREVLEEAQLMLASAKAVRDYTQDDLAPLLEQNPEHRIHFLAETVPFFGATSTFDKLREKYPDYTYRETALNPTNLKDLANGWESELIVGMRSHPDQQQVIGERDTAMGRQLFIAHPIKPDQGCLECHGVSTAAPKSMLNVYGPVHGFGWKKNDVVGAQIISVPMSLAIQIADKAFDELIVFLIATLIVTMAALDLGVYWFVIRPLRLVSATADRVSRGEKDVNLVVVTGRDEIATVTQSFNRMQMSLAKAFRMLEE